MTVPSTDGRRGSGRRRWGGVAVLAVAVLVLSVGTALGRPDIVGVASPPPIDPPPQAGDCLYAGPDGPWGVAEADGGYRENPYAHWFAPCRDPWYGEVVAVRTRGDILAGHDWTFVGDISLYDLFT